MPTEEELAERIEKERIEAEEAEEKRKLEEAAEAERIKGIFRYNGDGGEGKQR